MKVIDILNKIANGEEVPHFCVNGGMEYYIGCNGFIKDEDGEAVEWTINAEWLNEEVTLLEDTLNNKVELPTYEQLYREQALKNEELKKYINKLETQKEPKKKKKIRFKHFINEGEDTRWSNILNLNLNVCDLRDKVNEIIDYINKDK